MIRIQWQPTTRDLRLFAWVGFPGFLGVLALVLSTRGLVAPLTAVWIAAPALPVALLGALRPRAVRPIFLGLSLAGWPIGWVVSHIVLGVVYYLVVTPIGLALRLAGRDPMGRTFDRAAKSYWTERPPVGETARYFKQY